MAPAACKLRAGFRPFLRLVRIVLTPPFHYYIHTVRRLFGDDAPWCAAGIGASQLTLNEWAISAGGHARTGLEDNVRLDRHSLAPSNASLVRRTVEICDKYDRAVATWQEARRLLGLDLPERGNF